MWTNIVLKVGSSVWLSDREICRILSGIKPEFSSPTSHLYRYLSWQLQLLTHWGRVTHICVGKLTIIGTDNGLSPERRQAIIWTNAGILLIGPLGTNFSEILIEIQTFSLKKIRLKCRLRNVVHFVSASMCQLVVSSKPSDPWSTQVLVSTLVSV